MTIDDFDPNYKKPKPMDIEGYQGMSKESEEEYQKRQAEPLFKTAKQLTPMNELAKHFENLKCNNEKNGCIIPKSHSIMYWCPVCTMLKAMGTDFFVYEGRLTEEMIWKMTVWQRDEWKKQRDYWIRWLDNYPRGATG